METNWRKDNKAPLTSILSPEGRGRKGEGEIRRLKPACPVGAKRLFGAATILFLIFNISFLILPNVEARFLFLEKKKTGQEEKVKKKRRKPVNPAEQMEKLKSKDPNERVHAVRALGQVKDKKEIDDTIKALAKVLNDEDFNVRAYAVRSLGKIKDNKVLNYIMNTLKDESLSVRIEAIKALGKIGDKKVIRELKEMLKDKNPRVSIAAAESLGKLDDKIGLELVLKEMENEDVRVRIKAILALRSIKEFTPEVKQALEKAKADDDKRIKDAVKRTTSYLESVEYWKKKKEEEKKENE